MSALPVPVDAPALPDDVALSQHIPDWPIFSAIHAHLEGLTGPMVFSMGEELGSVTMQQLTELDTKLKKCEPAFKEWYKNSPGWHAEKAAKFWSDYRIGRLKELDEMRARIARIQADFDKARDDEIDRNAAALRSEQLRIAEEEQRRQIAEAEARKAAAAPEIVAEVEAEIEQMKNARPTPAAVSRGQAAVGLPKAPPTVTKKKVYIHRITNLALFIKWLGGNPSHIATVDPRFSFAKWKNNPIEPDGTKTEEDREMGNKG